jgi:hypothetical protein
LSDRRDAGTPEATGGGNGSVSHSSTRLLAPRKAAETTQRPRIPAGAAAEEDHVQRVGGRIAVLERLVRDAELCHVLREREDEPPRKAAACLDERDPALAVRVAHSAMVA